MDDVITLISNTFTTDENGVQMALETKREIFCRMGSVTRAEFFNGGRAGLNPEFVFTVFAGDYMGEEIVAFHGRSYAIYRTYFVPDSDYIELYVQRKGGTNGKE